MSNVPAQSREANRFFARWGFSSVVVRRVVSTSVLRRRLTPARARSSSTRSGAGGTAPALQHESA